MELRVGSLNSVLLAPSSMLHANIEIMKKITKNGNPYLSWVLRILLILMILFWALFSIDVFEEEQGFWNIVVAFLMHNIPVFVMIIILIVAWKWENIGGILLMLGIIGISIFFFSRSGRFMYGTFIMVGIPFLIGGLFIINYYLLGNKQAAEDSPAS